MKTNDISLFKKCLKASGFLLMLALLFFLISVEEGVAVFSGVLLSTIFVLSSSWVVETFHDVDNKQFLQVFFISTAIRFLLIIILFGILIGTTKINEIYFTVSFIISYLCLSVIEMIFINKILQKSSNKRP